MNNIMQVEQASSKAKNLCQRLQYPSVASSKAISSLFPACGSSARKKRFDPLEDCVAGEQQS